MSESNEKTNKIANISLPFPDKTPWDLFPLGEDDGGKEVCWNVSTYPHMLIAGATGSGKSVTQRNILIHALQSPEWNIFLIDQMRVELKEYEGHPNVTKVATELEDSLSLVNELEKEMERRYQLMQTESEASATNISSFRELASPPPALLLMVDESFVLLSPSGIDSIEGRNQDEMKTKISSILTTIARIGRAAGLHMVLGTQRLDADVYPNGLIVNIDARIAQGRMDTTPSLMTLGSDAATRIPPIKGRGIFKEGFSMTPFQTYYLPPKQLPMVLEMSAAIAQGDTSFLEFTEPKKDVSHSPN